MPELQAVIEDKSKIPSGLENFYIEKDGKFTLQVEGMKTQADFDAYADALKKRFTDAGADFAKHKGSDLTRDDVLDVVNTALEKFAGQQGGQGGGDDKGKGTGPDADTAKRLHDLERNVASLTEQNEKLISERDTAIQKSTTTTIRNALTEAATKAGAIPEGIPNLVTLAEPHFEMTQDGSVVTKLDNGQTPNQNPTDYFAGAARKDEFRMFWPASKGSGADQGDGSGGGDLSGENPWTKAGWNLTKQGQLFKADPAEANRLMEAAGVKLGATEPVR